MSKKFYAVNRATGDKWKPKCKGNFLVMLDSGYLAEVSGYGEWEPSITPLNPKIWERRINKNMKRIINES